MTLDEFEHALHHALGKNATADSLGVAVSGGPDSMALAWLLSHYADRHGSTVYAYTVDHGLRVESAAEAQGVAGALKKFKNIQHKILKWEGQKPTAGILEEARRARYNLLADAAKADGVQTLCVAHHRDDQAETFLFRLAKGSGLDGLAGMQASQDLFGVRLLRPLLGFAKQDLIDVCEEHDIAYVNDPTNENSAYMRPRLRAAQEVLEAEGLSPKRLAATAQRLARARSALEDLTDYFFEQIQKPSDDGGVAFDYDGFAKLPEEIVLRIVLKSIEILNPSEDYGPRLERVEDLVSRILGGGEFKSATLAGCLFAIKRKENLFTVTKELSA